MTAASAINKDADLPRRSKASARARQPGKVAGRESKAARAARAEKVYQVLLLTYPDASCALVHRNPFELLIATILSAQCTDARVNMVTPVLFKHYPDAAAMARADQAHLEELVRTTGFFRNKAKSIKGASQAIVEQHGGKTPSTMEELIQLPGVARKTANVVLGNAFDRNVGVVVDTHVQRLSRRLGFTAHSDPGKIERDLMALFPQESWTMLAHLLIHHGRQICTARRPWCERCPLNRLCPKVGVSADIRKAAAVALDATE